MFGYITADKPELRVREYEYYRGIYCGLCRALGKCGGGCARLTLSYDFAFMALVRMAIEGIRPEFKAQRCIAHPLKKRPMAQSSSVLEFCAAASILLSYRKIKDDVEDERGMRKAAALIAAPIVSAMRRRPSRKYAELENSLSASLFELSQYEKGAAEPSVDRPAEIFGSLLSNIFAYGLEGKDEKLARKIGLHVGKWIYIIDAIDDYRDDIRKKRFNPLIGAFGEEGLTPSVCSMLESSLTCELMEAEKAFDLIDYDDADLKEIISNIIYLGMPKRARAVLSAAERKEDK